MFFVLLRVQRCWRVEYILFARRKWKVFVSIFLALALSRSLSLYLSLSLCISLSLSLSASRKSRSISLSLSLLLSLSQILTGYSERLGGETHAIQKLDDSVWCV